MKIKTLETIIGIFLVLITLTLIGIEISNDKVSDFNKNFIDSEIGNTNSFLETIQNQISYIHSDLINVLQPDIYVINTSGIAHLDTEETELAEKYLNGELSKEIYLYEVKELFAKKYYSSISKVNQERSILLKTYTQGTPWELARTILIIIEFIFVFSTMYLYMLLLVKRK